MTRHPLLSNCCLLVATLLYALRFLRGQDCLSGAVRLAGGTNHLEGRVEVCLYSSVDSRPIWGTVCNRGWDRLDAEVVCGQLGVPQENYSQIVPSVYFDGPTLTFHWTNTNCTGDETHLVNCSRTPPTSECSDYTQAIGVICSVPSPECDGESVRIVDAHGNLSTVGRVEYCLGGRWGSVCRSKWDDDDAKVVCRQLGITGANVVPEAISNMQTPQAGNLVPIGLDSVQCNGREGSLSECHSVTYVEGCTHVHDVGVNCTPTIECLVDGSVQLVGGDGVSEGRVEYCRDHLWTSVCPISWDHFDAQVVCRQLGFVGVSVSERDRFPSDGDHSDRVNFGPADCTGNETQLSECSVKSSSCFFEPTAGVKCYNESNCEPTLSVRLRGGALSEEMGTVELCYGDWGFVCDDEWDDVDAGVICRQLGLTGGVAIPASPFGTETGRFLLDDLGCTGDESSITECSHPGLGSDNCKSRMHEQAAVICGTTREAQLPRCTDEQMNKTMAATNTSITVGSFGVCEEFSGQSSICASVYSEMPGYVYHKTGFDQSGLLDQLGQALSILQGNQECIAMIKSIVCHYFLPPCGGNGTVYLPRGVCSEECFSVQNSCSDEWMSISKVLGISTLGVINCTATQSYLSPLPACCTSAGVSLPDATSTPTSSNSTTVMLTSPTDPTPTSQNAGLVTAIVISLLALLLIVLVTAAFMIGCVISARRRKKAFRRLQMTVLSGASVRSTYQRDSATFMGGEEPTVTLRNGSNIRGPLAVPNPYANKKELKVEGSNLLNPQESLIMNRVSSSIIRELTSNLLIPYTRLKLLDCVGHGEFGVVYKAHYSEPDGEVGYKTSIVAVKTLKGMYDQDQVNKIMEESIKMKNFDHPNVLILLGVCLDAGSAPYVVMPYMANGSLLHYLKKERRNLVLPVDSDEDVRCEVCKRLVVMCLQISCGMEYLAHERFVHRDLAARNCMIDIHFVIKIADFGLSEDMYAKNYFRQSDKDKSVKLPVKWMAPESLADGLFSEKSDVWSFGVTCWEVFSGGKTPYPGVDPMTLSKMLEGGKRLSKPLNSACPEELYQVMQQCWAQSPEQRPTFSDLMETISEYTERIAGYLDINSYNPFAAAYEEIKSPEENQVVSSPEQVLQHMKNKELKLRSTPCNSPRVSPRTSPRGSPRGSPRSSPHPTPGGTSNQLSRTPNPSPKHSPIHSPKRRLSVPVGAGAGIRITITDESPK